MTEEPADRSRWAWDTAPTDGSYPGPVYIGDMEDWSHEETKKRRDTFRDPWGGVWTEPLRNGATKAKWGTRTFDSGRYRCCDDLHDCGVFVSVAQGEKIQWHFKRQWGYGVNNSKAHNQYECKNESKYKGPSRFHNIVVNEIHNFLRGINEFTGKRIVFLSEERAVAQLDNFEPDVYVEFEDETWFAIEVILTSAPDREKHEKFGQNLITINLNELDCIESDRAFSRWIREGDVLSLLDFETSAEKRALRFEERTNRFKRQDEREFRASVLAKISKCREEFGFYLEIDVSKVFELSEIEAYFNKEKDRRALSLKISLAIDKNVKKYGERLERSVDEFNSVKEVNDYYKAELGEKLKRENLKKLEEKRQTKLLSIENAIKRNVEKYGERLPKNANDFTLKKDVNEYYKKELGEKLKQRKRKEREEAKQRTEARRARRAQALKKAQDVKNAWSNINKKHPQYKKWLRGIISDGSSASQSVFRYSYAKRHLDLLRTDFDELMKREKGTPFLENLIERDLVSSLPSIKEYSKWGQIDLLLEKHVGTSLEVIRIILFGKLNFGYEVSRNLEEFCGSMMRIHFDEEDKQISQYCLKVIDSLGSYKGHGLFMGYSMFSPNFQCWRLLETHSGSYTHYIPSKLGKRTDITSFINSNLEFWKAINRGGISNIPSGFDRQIVETSKAPSKPKVTRRADADFARAQKEDAAAQKQREKDRASKAEKKTTKEKRGTGEYAKKAYFNEVGRKRRDVNTADTAKKKRIAKAALAHFRKANKGKYEDDES